MRFTDLTIRALKPAGSKTYWDDSTPAFGVRVGKHVKTWIVMRGRNRERLTIGRYPDLPLIDARKEAKRLLSTLPESRTPAVAFQMAREQFLRDNYRDCSPRTLYESTRHLTNHFANLDNMVLTEIDDQHIKKQLDKIKAPSERLHAYRFARTLFKWCTRPPRKYIKHSPMEGYEPPGKDRKGTRTLSDPELRAVWLTADSPPHSAVRLLILWGTRSGETRALRRLWASASYPSNQDSTITIPGAFTKNGRDHAIPILPLAQTVLDGTDAGSPYYFPSRWGDSHLSDGAWSKIKREVQEKSGTKNWQLRDLRRTFRSNIARLKVQRELALFMRDLTRTPLIVDVPNIPVSKWPKMNRETFYIVQTLMMSKYHYFPQYEQRPAGTPVERSTDPDHWG
jgi:hypothetical protein